MTAGGENAVRATMIGQQSQLSASVFDPAHPVAQVRLLQGKTLVGSARGHSLRTDRPLANGGSDLGPTSGELLLIAIGSCVVGTLNGFLTAGGETPDGLTATVRFDAAAGAEKFGRILVDVRIPGVAGAEQRPELVAAAGAGRVTQRIRAGSEVAIRIVGDDAT